MVSVQLDPEHKQDIVKAYEGADVVFVRTSVPSVPTVLLIAHLVPLQSMTNFWQHVDGERVSFGVRRQLLRASAGLARSYPLLHLLVSSDS